MIYVKLFLAFAKIGIFGFGGGLAMLPMIYQSAESFGLMSQDEFANLVGIAQATPGPLAVNAATYVGYNCAGVFGALAATIGVALPSFLLVLLACYFLDKFKDSSLVASAFTGVRPVTVGLIASAVIFIGESAFSSLDPVLLAIAAGSAILAGTLKCNPILIVFVAGVIGALLCG